MIKINKPYIRRKEMDSVLTSMVEEDFDVISELRKKAKKSIKKDYFFFLREMEQAFNVLMTSMPIQEKNEVIISALSPSYVYKTLVQLNFIPIVVDVETETGVFSLESIEKQITDRTAFIINNSVFGVMYPTTELLGLGIQVIELVSSGFGISESGDILGSNADYSIISMEENDIVSALGGAVLSMNNKTTGDNIDNFLKNRRHLILSRLNASFALSQLDDLETLLDKRNSIVSIYKDSVLKSGYHTFENWENNSYNLFPVILKRGLKEIQKYCRKHEVETLKAFNDSVVQEVEGIKCSNAKSLSNKTILLPLNTGLNKTSIAHILKILSTLP